MHHDDVKSEHRTNLKIIGLVCLFSPHLSRYEQRRYECRYNRKSLNRQAHTLKRGEIINLFKTILIDKTLSLINSRFNLINISFCGFDVFFIWLNRQQFNQANSCIRLDQSRKKKISSNSFQRKPKMPFCNIEGLLIQCLYQKLERGIYKQAIRRAFYEKNQACAHFYSSNLFIFCRLF